jgi:hypothetical protein
MGSPRGGSTARSRARATAIKAITAPPAVGEAPTFARFVKLVASTRRGTALLMDPKQTRQDLKKWREDERCQRVNALGWLKELERYYESLPWLRGEDLRRHQILYEILIARQHLGDTSRRTEHPFDRKWVAQCEKVRRFHERISLEWAKHTARGFGTLAAAHKAHPDTDEKYRAYVKRIHAVRKGKDLSLTSALKTVARTPPRTPESTLWRAWKRFGVPAK